MTIFAAIGPFLAWLYALVLAWSSMHPKPIFEEGWYWPASLILSYAFSIVPMLAAAWVDARLSDKWWRSIACFAVGFAMSGRCGLCRRWCVQRGGVRRAVELRLQRCSPLLWKPFSIGDSKKAEEIP